MLLLLTGGLLLVTGVSCRQQMGWHSGVIRRELALLSEPCSELGICNSTSDKLPILPCHYISTSTLKALSDKAKHVV